MTGIEAFFYTSAGCATHKYFDSVYNELLGISNLSRIDKDVLGYTLRCSAAGSYPPWDYYSGFYSTPGRKYTRSELDLLKRDLQAYYVRQAMVVRLTELMSTTTDAEGLSGGLSALLSDGQYASGVDTLEGLSAGWSYSEELDVPRGDGLTIGVPEIDALTSGLQEGNVGSICGFTGSGKSITCLSMLFRNARRGRKCVYVSLELDPKLVWLILEARYMYEVKGIQLNSQDLIFHKLSDDLRAKVQAAEDDFARDIKSCVLIADTTVFTQDVMTDVSRLRLLYQQLAQKLGGLDLVVYDHVNQLDLLFQDRGRGLGNVILVKLRDAGKTVELEGGHHPVTLFAVQCNREGYKRAVKRNGVYDLPAIGDLNEVERTSTYVIFIYTDTMAGETQECKFSMLKHRLGRTLPEPVIASFLPGVCVIGDSVEQISYVDEFANMGDAFGGSASSLDTELSRISLD